MTRRAFHHEEVHDTEAPVRDVDTHLHALQPLLLGFSLPFATMPAQPLLVKHLGKLLLVVVASSVFYASYASSAIYASIDRYTPYWRPRRCNPYEQLGFLSYGGPQHPHENRWTPYRDNCHSPALFASLVRSAWGTMPNTSTTGKDMPGDWWQQEAGPDGRAWEDVEWAKGKTVLYVGDSIGRENVKYFCQVSSYR